MVVIRPVRRNDLDQLLDLASMTSFGLTTLPKDRKLLERRIRESEQGFARIEHEPGHGTSFLFVMEDLKTGRVVGTSGIVAKVGGYQPFYAYRIEDALHESEMLKVSKRIPTLHLVTEHDGPCEIGSLFLAPDYRAAGIGRLLSLSRFLFMAEHPDHFDQTVIAEMRGVIDDRGRSAFWDALGKHFFAIDFPKADYLSIVNKEFIADLMPRHPIYLPLLSPEAQAVVGRVHHRTVPAQRILEREGFTSSGMVDIFEAGPILSCKRDRIRSAEQSIRTTVEQISDESIDAPPHIIMRTDVASLACQAPVEMRSSCGLRIDSSTALTLGVKLGDAVRSVAMCPERPPGMGQ
ncbi:MAG: arginine N-succinyltransferase [Pirellulaceae bacterium]|jgi:arginine N-succinyltransferase|nr:arginine N-succinyltransferase [Pirellulaceae bacterium]